MAASASGAGATDLVAEGVDATLAFRADRLREVLERGMVRWGHHGALERLVHPLVLNLGDAWQKGGLTAAHEHFATALIREFLLGAAGVFSAGREGPCAVVATPPGQMHELGAVMAAVAATHFGWQVVYLGTSLPAAEIAGAAVQNQAKVVLLSLVYPEDDPRLPAELGRLRRCLPSAIAILAGGGGVGAYAAALAEARVGVLQDLNDLGTQLGRLRQAALTGGGIASDRAEGPDRD